MTKREFLKKLRRELRGIPKEELEDRISFYSEIIDDRIEEGYSERAAISSLGAISTLGEQIKSECSEYTEKTAEKRSFGAWKIVLLVLGSPVWLSLLVAVAAIVISLLVTFWALVITLWAVFISFAVASPSAIILGGYFLLNSQTTPAIFLFGSALILIGVTVISFIGCKMATTGMLTFTKSVAIATKKCFS